jgi:hypothetical protein
MPLQLPPNRAPSLVTPENHIRDNIFRFAANFVYSMGYGAALRQEAIMREIAAKQARVRSLAGRRESALLLLARGAALALVLQAGPAFANDSTASLE